MNDHTIITVWKIALAVVCSGFIFSSGFHFGLKEAQSKYEIKECK